MPDIEWISTLDNSSFTRSMKEMESQVRQTKAVLDALGVDAATALEKMDAAGRTFNNTLRSMASLAGISFSISQMSSFARKVSETRAYFQDIESSMKVFLGNEEKAADFTKKLKDYAYYNMFDFSDLANASKQMIAYGHDIDTIIPRLDQLSNVARGTNAPLMEMVNAYNKAKNLGGLDGRDLQSWAGKGLIVKDILKEMGEEANGSRVSFEQFNRVLDHVTGEGGMFHNLMGEQMDNISAEKGQLEDTLDSMYNEIGERYEDTIVKWYKMRSAIAESVTENPFTSSMIDMGADVSEFLIDHYEAIAKSIVSLVAAYGTYRAALVATRAVEESYQGLMQKKETDELTEAIYNETDAINELKRARGELMDDLKESVAKGEMSEETAKALEEQRDLLNERVKSGELSAEGATQIGALQKELAILQEKRKEEEGLNQKKIEDIEAQIAANDKEVEAYKNGIEQKKKELLELEKVRRLYQDDMYATEEDDYTSPEYKAAQKANEEFEKEKSAWLDYKDKAEEAINKLHEQNEVLEAQAMELKGNTAAVEGNSAAEGANTVQEKANTVSKNANKVSTEAQTDSETANTAATEKNTISQRLNAIQLKASTAASRIWTVAIGQMRAAFDGLKAAIMTNPLGMVLGGISLALPWIMELVSGTDDAADAEAKYANEAKEATDKVDALNAVINSTSESSKSHRDAVQELAGIYKEYGFEVESATDANGKEVPSVQAMNEQHEALVKTLKEEALERERIKGIQSIDEEYGKKEEEVKKDTKDDLEDFFSARESKYIVDNIVNEEVIDNAAEALERYNAALESGDSAKAAVELKALNEAYGAASVSVENYSVALGKNETETLQIMGFVSRYIERMAKLRAEQKKATEEENKAAEAAGASMDGITDKTVKSEPAKKASEEIADLFRTLEELDKVEASPKVKSDDITKAGEEAGNAKDKVGELDSSSANPKVDTEELKNAISDTQSAIDGVDDLTSVDGKVHVNDSDVTSVIAEAADAVDGVVELDLTSADPQVNKEQIESAISKIDTAIKNMDTLDVAKAHPNVDLTGYNVVMTKLFNIKKLLSDIAGVKIDDAEVKVNEKREKEIKKKQEADTRKTTRKAISEKKKELDSWRKEGHTDQQYNDKIKELRTEQSSFNVGSEGYNFFENEIELTQALTGKGRKAASKKAAQDAKKASKEEKKQSEDAAKRRQKEFDNEQKQEEERRKQEQTTRAAVEKERIAAIEDDGQRRREEEAEQHRLNMQAVDEREREMRKKHLEEIRAEWEINNKDKTKVWTDTEEAKKYTAKNNYEGIALTEDEQKQIDAEAGYEAVRWNKILSDRYKSELESMRGYLKEYGTLEQQKLAITQEYEDKISKAGTEGEKMRLQKEMEKALNDFDINLLKQEIDWSLMFAGVGDVLYDETKAALDKVEAYINSDKFKNLAPTDQQTMLGLRNDLRQRTGSGVGAFNFSIYGKIADDLKAYQQAVVESKEAHAAHKEALDNLTKREEELENATSGAEKALAKSNLEFAKQRVQTTANAVREADANVQTTKEDVTVDTTNAQSALDNFGSSLQQMNNGSLKGFADGLINLINAIGGNGKNNGLAGLGKAGGIIGAILAIIDALGDDAAGFFEQLLEKVADTVEKLLQDLIPKVIPSLVEGILHLVEGVINGLGSLIGSLFGQKFDIGNFITGGNGEEVAKTTERLTEVNENLRRSIDGLREEIAESGGGKSIKSAAEALEAQRKYIENQRDILDTQQGYHNNHHSNAHYWNLDNATQSQINSLLSDYALRYGKNAHTVGADWASFRDLTPEENDYIRTHDAQLWQTLTDIGKYDKSEFFNAFADLAGSEEEILKELKDALTQTSFDSLKSSFISSLMDMDKSASDFADDFSKMMMEAVLNARISDLLDEQIQEFYDKWAELSKDASGTGYDLTQAELDELSQMWDDIVAQGMEIRDQAASITGYGESSEKSATYNASKTFTQEQGDILNGRLAAIQITSRENGLIAQQIQASINAMTSIVTGNGGALTEMRNILLIQNNYLEDIARQTKSIYEDFGMKIDRIAENTRNL